MLNVYVGTINLFFRYKDLAQDTTYVGMTRFAATPEVLQNTTFETDDMHALAESNNDWTYLKTPAGIFTEITLPIDEIYAGHTNDSISQTQISLTRYNATSPNSLDIPQALLMVRKDNMYSFFENNELPDNITSFTVTHNSVNTNQYTFQNIARLVTTCINEKQAAREAAGDAWNETKWMEENPDWDKVLLVPVSVEYDDNYYSSPTIIRMQHDLRPGFAKLKGGPAMENGKLKNPLQLEVISTTFHD